jgi:hypothetical protein
MTSFAGCFFYALLNGAFHANKIGIAANWQSCETKKRQMQITDTGATNEMIAPFGKLGPQVIRG